MKHIGYTILLVAALFLLGTVGGIEQGLMTLGEGITKSIVCLVIALASVAIIKGQEEKTND